MNNKIKYIVLKIFGEDYKVFLLRKSESDEGALFKEYALVDSFGIKLTFHTSKNDTRIFSVYVADSGTFANPYFCKKWAQFIEEVEQGE